ncbi:hypothetical protein [Pseudonocardia sp. ICBG1293]|uniref:hypothetical protein n=1 Tax=Pseudonocardia sp. ICBG1293 TaxID=2844382 RepID=UPI001CCC4882|nr:hypothetical protein [Pseudonocardia sp. ICBG1293]
MNQAEAVVEGGAAAPLPVLARPEGGRRRAATRPDTNTVTTPAAVAVSRADTGPWLALVILGLGIVAAMLILTTTWT